MDALGDREQMRMRDEHLSEQIAKKEWERIRREGTMSPMASKHAWWRDGVEGNLKSPMSDGGTTLAKSPSRDSGESSWKEHWRRMGEEDEIALEARRSEALGEEQLSTSPRGVSERHVER